MQGLKEFVVKCLGLYSSLLMLQDFEIKDLRCLPSAFFLTLNVENTHSKDRFDVVYLLALKPSLHKTTQSLFI